VPASVLGERPPGDEAGLTGSDGGRASFDGLDRNAPVAAAR
jgi:hypothetical protein